MIKKLTLCAIVLALAGCSAREEAAKQPLVRVEGERLVLSEPDKAEFLKLVAVDRDPGGILRLPGRLAWNEEKTVRVFPQLAGRVQRIAADVGQPVKAGQTLALLDSGDYGQAAADARKAAADLGVAEKALARNRELREAGVIAEKDWQLAEADALRARAEADRARRRLAGLGGLAGEGDGWYALKSPLAGIVVERNVNPGMEFRPEQAAAPLFVVSDPQRLWLQLDAAESDLGHLKPGAELAAEVKQYPGVQFKATIRHIADFVDPQTRTIKVRCEVANPERRLKAEMFAQALISLPASEALAVPATAVMLFGDRRYVLVEEGKGQFRRQLVEAAAERDGKVVIVAGLEAGERVVVEGNLHLVKYFKSAPAAAR